MTRPMAGCMPAVQDIPEYPGNTLDMIYQPCCVGCGWTSTSLFFDWLDAANFALYHADVIVPENMLPY